MPIGEQRPGITIVNRSQRVWLFGFLRMIPFLLFAGPVALFVAVSLLLGPKLNFQPWQQVFVGVTYLIFLIVAFVLDRSNLLNPVDVIWLDKQLFVKRLVGQPKSIALDRVVRLIVDASMQQDFDERFEHTVDIIIRLRRGRAALSISRAAVPVLLQWAQTYHIPVEDRRTAPTESRGDP